MFLHIMWTGHILTLHAHTQNADPDKDWDKKYKTNSKSKSPLKKQEIFKYGRQLLEVGSYDMYIL